MPDLATLPVFFTVLAVLVTAENAFLALLMVPFLPYDVLAFTTDIPFFTALLKALAIFLRGLPLGIIPNSSNRIVCGELVSGNT